MEASRNKKIHFLLIEGQTWSVAADTNFLQELTTLSSPLKYISITAVEQYSPRGPWIFSSSPFPSASILKNFLSSTARVNGRVAYILDYTISFIQSIQLTLYRKSLNCLPTSNSNHQEWHHNVTRFHALRSSWSSRVILFFSFSGRNQQALIDISSRSVCFCVHCARKLLIFLVLPWLSSERTSEMGTTVRVNKAFTKHMELSV